jgi:alpha/beta superfamily hydrolase
MAPRPFERPATIALPQHASEDGLVLEGLHVPSAEERDLLGGAVIAPPHPLYGGSMESPVVTEIAHACEHAGLESLRFNWRGVGASSGAVTGDADAGVEDYAASLDWIEDTVEGLITACGYSFGAATAVRAVAGRPRVRHLLLVSPPPVMLDTDALAAFPGRVSVLVGDGDDFAPVGALEEILSVVEGASFEVIPGADHFFITALAEVGRVARSFLTPNRASGG